MVDIQSVTAENRRGKEKIERKKKKEETTGRIHMYWPALLYRAAIKKEKETRG